MKSKFVANTCHFCLSTALYLLTCIGVTAQELPSTSTGSVEPPPVPNRSEMPALEQEELLPPRGTGIPKPSLSWRTGATKKNTFVSSSFSMPAFAPPIQRRFLPEMRVDAKRVYLSSTDDAFFALLSTCPKKGFAVLFMDSLAGRLVASVNSATVTFTVHPAPGNRAVINANVEKGDPQSLVELLNDLLLATGASLSNGGAF